MQGDAAAIKEAILTSDVIIVDIIEEIEMAQSVIDHLNNENVEDNKTIVFLSMALTWGQTKPAQVKPLCSSFRCITPTSY